MAQTIQRQWNVSVAYARQTALGTPFTGAGSTLLALNTGRGNMTMDAIPSLQIRQDGMTIRGRHGTQKTKGSYKSELQGHNFDQIMESVMRGRFVGGGALGGSILTNPAAGLLQRDYYTFEEFEADLTQSEVYQDSIFTMFELTMRPNGMVEFNTDWVGTGSVAGLTAATGSPQLPGPTFPLNGAVPMAALDATVNLSSIGVLLDLTAFTLKVDLRATAPPVAGSRFSPDVFDGVMEISGSMTIMRRDLIPFQDAINETSLSLVVNTTTPLGTLGPQYTFTVPYFTIQSAEKSEFRRDGGPLNVVIPFPAALVGIDPVTLTMFQIERNY
jgi:hypothetical protein